MFTLGEELVYIPVGFFFFILDRDTDSSICGFQNTGQWWGGFPHRKSTTKL